MPFFAYMEWYDAFFSTGIVPYQVRIIDNPASEYKSVSSKRVSVRNGSTPSIYFENEGLLQIPY